MVTFNNKTRQFKDYLVIQATVVGYFVMSLKLNLGAI